MGFFKSNKKGFGDIHSTHIRHVDFYYQNKVPTLSVEFDTMRAASDFLGVAETMGALGASRNVHIEPDPCRVVIPGLQGEHDMGAVAQALFAYIGSERRVDA